MIVYFPKLSRNQKFLVYPLLVVIVSIPFMIATLMYDINTHGLQLVAIAGVILVQIYFSKRSFNTCGTCGHQRHMHDKRDLVKRGHTSLTKIVCDNYRKGKWEKNYEPKYWNGEDSIQKWDSKRDK